MDGKSTPTRFQILARLSTSVIMPPVNDAPPAALADSDLPALQKVSPWHAGLAAARANLLPGVVLSVFAVGLLLAFELHGPTHAWMQRMGEWKLRLGWPFAVLSTALFGGVIPGLVQRMRPALRHTMPWPALAFLAAFWGYKGLEVDLLYKLQAMLFGEGKDPITIGQKILLDMGIYCPIWAVPSTVLAYAYKDRRFNWRRATEPIRRLGLWHWYTQVALPVIISNWAVWVPAVCVIYCLPLALQLPMQNLVLCFWSLLLVIQVQIADDEADDSPASLPSP